MNAMARASQDEIVELAERQHWSHWTKAVGGNVVVEAKTDRDGMVASEGLHARGWTIAAIDQVEGLTRLHLAPMPGEWIHESETQDAASDTSDLESPDPDDVLEENSTAEELADSLDANGYDVEVVDHTEADEWEEYEYYRRLREGTRPYQVAKALAESDLEWTPATDITDLFEGTGEPYTNAYLHLTNLVRANVAEKRKDDDGSVSFQLREPFRREFAQFDPLNNTSAAPADD